MGRVAQIQEGQKVLEIGSGYPLYKLYSQKVGKDGVFVALDIDQVIQQRSQKIGYWVDKFLNDEDHSGERRVTGNANELPFADNSFDTLIASNFTGGRWYIDEAYRVLKPGGKLITTFAEIAITPKRSRGEANMAGQAGFTDIKVKPSMPANIIPGVAWNYYVEATKPLAE